MSRVLTGLKMCDNFSAAVRRILTEAERGRGAGQRAGRPFTVLVEGNIGSGKTSFLSQFSGLAGVETLAEPVERWRDLNGSGHNLLQLMYEDPARWGLTFQTYVQLTMLQQHTRPATAPVRLMERSLYSAKFCFVENLLRSGKMPRSEYEVLTAWFDFLMSNTNLDLGADLVLYLHTRPERALERLRGRSRGEERLIQEQLVHDLHCRHEEWLRGGEHTCPAPVLVIDANKDVEELRKSFEKVRLEFSEEKGVVAAKEGETGDKENNEGEQGRAVGVKRLSEERLEEDRRKKLILTVSN